MKAPFTHARMPPARPDGRPLYFDLPSPEMKVPCLTCAAQLGLGHAYKRGEVFFNDPANSPVTGPHGLPDEAVYYLCKNHLPENAVIYDPVTQLCRDKSGTNSWSEEFFMPTEGDI